MRVDRKKCDESHLEERVSVWLKDLQFEKMTSHSGWSIGCQS